METVYRFLLPYGEENGKRVFEIPENNTLTQQLQAEKNVKIQEKPGDID